MVSTSFQSNVFKHIYTDSALNLLHRSVKIFSGLVNLDPAPPAILFRGESLEWLFSSNMGSLEWLFSSLEWLFSRMYFYSKVCGTSYFVVGLHKDAELFFISQVASNKQAKTLWCRSSSLKGKSPIIKLNYLLYDTKVVDYTKGSSDL